MGSNLSGQRPFASAVTRIAAITLGLAAAFMLSACTTTEGTNAMTDFGTFEREVMTSTLTGFGVIGKGEEKDEDVQPRGPLVLPKDARSLPAPSTGETSVASLPVDSDRVQIDTTGLSDEDLKRLRNARVVDLRTVSGRPLTDAESKQLTARMTAARLKPGARPLYLPPEEYFFNLEGTDLVCMSKSGELVPVNSNECPKEIREAIARKSTVSGGGMLGGGADQSLENQVR
jgi:hypothetical protein